MKKERVILPRDFSERTIQEYYSRVAWFYDVWSWLTESKAARKAIEFAQIRDGEQILEIAVGTGSVFAEIVKRNRSGRNVGIDISPSMLSLAEKRLRNVDRSSFDLQIGNARQLPFEDHKFHVVINNFMIDLLPERDFVGVLNEFKRVLKPTGRLVISTMAFGTNWYNKIWHWIPKQFPSLLTGCRPVSMYDYLARVGFSNIQVERLSQCTFPSEVFRAEKGPTSSDQSKGEVPRG